MWTSTSSLHETYPRYTIFQYGQRVVAAQPPSKRRHLSEFPKPKMVDISKADKSDWNCWYQYSLSPTAPTTPDKISKLPNAPSTCRPAIPSQPALWHPQHSVQPFETNGEILSHLLISRGIFSQIYALSYTAVDPYPGIGFFDFLNSLSCSLVNTGSEIPISLPTVPS